jgi:hypothetical protein
MEERIKGFCMLKRKILYVTCISQTNKEASEERYLGEFW